MIHFQAREHARAFNSAAPCKNLNGNRGLSCTALNSTFQPSKSSFLIQVISLHSTWLIRAWNTPSNHYWMQFRPPSNSQSKNKRKIFTHLIQLPCQANLCLCSGRHNLRFSVTRSDTHLTISLFQWKKKIIGSQQMASYLKASLML